MDHSRWLTKRKGKYDFRFRNYYTRSIMRTIETLNNQYISEKDHQETLSILLTVISDGESKHVTPDSVSGPLRLISDFISNPDNDRYPMLRDALSVGECFLDSFSAIQAYRVHMSSLNQKDDTDISSTISEAKIIQKRFEEAKENFRVRYSCVIDSLDSLYEALLLSLKNAQSAEQEKLDNLRERARQLMTDQLSSSLRIQDPVPDIKEPPEKILAARLPQKNKLAEILRDIGIKTIFKNILLDMHNQGNMIITTPIDCIEDKQIDEFLLSYIFRFIESFPLGSVNVHIFDENTKYVFKRLHNCFQDEKNGEIAKRNIQIHTSLNELTVIRDIICEDVFRKTSLEVPDLYAIHKVDHSDPFNLIVLRDGILDGNGYAAAEVLDTIRYLTDPSEIAHKCGIRFLILDNSASYEKNITASSKQYLDAINANCELKLGYNRQSGFSYEGKSVDVLHIEDNVDAFVQVRSMMLVDAINKKEKTRISIEDVAAAEIVQDPGNIMYIPVGKAGGEIIDLPLSCKDVGGSVAGQCIGYMVIGQSGSGKSSFFHSLVLNGCMKYSPKDLQFWLLDFKNGGASSKYSNSGIPHIKIIAENNKIDDALCLFQMILEEMERRNKLFNRNFTDNIIEYNQKAIENNLEYLPRIIIAIDEVQEIFREDNAAVLKNLISAISSRMRSSGMHFVMVAQNLSEGKSYMLKESFMPSATGRISFRVAQDVLRDSGYGDDFIQRKQEIADLKAGEAYISYGSGTIKKVKMAFASTDEMSQRIFVEILQKHKDFKSLKPKVIGSKKRLSLLSDRQGVQGNYTDVFAELKTVNGIYDAMIGEDVYRMNPFHIQFSQHENSSVLLLGSDRQMSSSMCASIAISLIKQDLQIHLFNGDRAKISDGYNLAPHPFMYICQKLSSVKETVHNHRLDQLKDVVKEMYVEYLKRQAEAQKADEELLFPASVLIVNDLFGIESFINNEIIENNENTGAKQSAGIGGFDFNYDIFAAEPLPQSQNAEQFREGIQNIITTLLKNGYRYNIHVVLAVKGDPSIWRTGRNATNINNVLLFNNTEYADQIENSYYLKEMLKNISSDEGEETIAVWVNRKSFSKIRPIIYSLSNPDEINALDDLIDRQEKQE